MKLLVTGTKFDIRAGEPVRVEITGIINNRPGFLTDEPQVTFKDFDASCVNIMEKPEIPDYEESWHIDVAPGPGLEKPGTVCQSSWVTSQQLFSSGYVYAPYMPLYSTPPVSLSEFVQRRRYGWQSTE